MQQSAPQELLHFMEAYEKANNSHVFANVAPFIAPEATYWFTDGSFTGIEEICQAVERTFAKIQDEKYKITDVTWPVCADAVAVCTYAFHWRGVVDGRPQSGSGRGTNVLRKSNDEWQIIHEHLSA